MKLNRNIGKLMMPVLIAAVIPTIAAVAAEDVITKAFQVQPGAKLVMDVDRGKIEVDPGGGNEVAIVVTRKVDKLDKEEAAEVFSRHIVEFTEEAGAVRGHAEFKLKPAWYARHPQFSVSYKVRVPASFDLDLQTHSGSIHVGDLAGKMTLQTSAGSLHLGRIKGPVQAQTHGGSIHLLQASSATLQTSAGSITVGEVAGDVTASTSGGSIRIDRATGNVNARTSAGRITLGEVDGSARLKTSGGSVSAKSVKGSLEAETSAGGIDLGQVHGPVTARTHGGSIKAGFPGKLQGDVQLQTSAGSIKVTATEELTADIDARASAGSVTSDFPVIGTVSKNRSSVTGKLNGGGPKLSLRTSGGSIQIKKTGTIELESPETK
jgi:DUF4097 and DUF4098 domain-containing protein YvlB